MRTGLPSLANLAKNRRGATAVEFALIAPIFLIMAFGVFEMGRAMWIKSSLQFAVEEAARYAMVNTSATTTTISTYAQTRYTNAGLSSTGVTFAATQDTTGGINYVSITGTTTFAVQVPIVPFPSITLSAKSRVPLS